MMWSSVQFLVVLCVIVIHTSVVHGGYIGSPAVAATGQDPTRNNDIEDKLAALIQRFDDQEVRLQELETTVSQNVEALKQKDTRIDALERHLMDLQLNIRPANTDTKDNPELLRPTSDTNNQPKHQHDVSNDAEKEVLRNVNARSNDNPGMDGPLIRAKARRIQPHVPDITNRVLVSGTSGVAFSSSLRDNTNILAHETIVYNDVLIDAGNGYNHGTGIYVVPKGGVYVFTWSVTSVNTVPNIATNLLINGSVRGGAIADGTSSSWGTGTGLIVTSVNEGDRVYINALQAGQIISENRSKTTFSGWRLF